jgi:thiamine biosynthesis lipoprotein
MGSACELKLYLSSQAEMAKAVTHISKLIDRIEQKYTRFKTTSITSKINCNAGIQAVEVDHETARLLDYANIFYEQSDGLFDITSGILRQAWDFKSNQLPSKKKLSSLVDKIGWNKVIWENNYISLPDKGMEIDFGGFVKEYAADVIATDCIENNIKHGLINLGGDVRVIGPHPDNKPWKVGIQHPRKMNQAIATVNLAHGGIATSGDYERYMIIDNVRYCHLLSPITGESIQPQLASVSVIADTCLIAGSFSTLAMLKSTQNKNWLSQVGLNYLQVDQSLKITGLNVTPEIK